MKRVATPLVLALLLAAGCVSARSAKYLQYSGFVEVTAQKTVEALNNGLIDLPTARKIYNALRVADAALDAFAASLTRSDPREVRDALWKAVDDAVLAAAELAEEFLK